MWRAGLQAMAVMSDNSQGPGSTSFQSGCWLRREDYNRETGNRKRVAVRCAPLSVAGLHLRSKGDKHGGKVGLRSGRRSLQGGVSQGRTHLWGSTQVLTEHAVGAEAAGRKVRGTKLQAPRRKLVQAEQVTVRVAEATKQGKGQAERPSVEVRAQVTTGSKMCM